MKKMMSAAVVVLCAGAANAQMKPSEIHTATGIAQIIARAEKCGYSVDKNALSAYYKDKGLATPEILAWISHKIAIEQGDIAAVSEPECELTKATAQQIGISR